MKCFIGLGSNLGKPRQSLEKALNALALISDNHQIRVSPFYETNALLPKEAPKSWNLRYTNAVAEIYWNQNPLFLFQSLKKIEREMGRIEKNHWSPRIIDLDILTWGDKKYETDQLTIPHKEIRNRAFTLDPMKDLEPLFIIPGSSLPVLLEARKLTTHQALVMSILNLTPDSFSDGGELNDLKELDSKLDKIDTMDVPIIDLGAESTRPGAQSVDQSEEWSRLEPVLKHINNRYLNSFRKPLLSIDTRNPEIMIQSLNYKIDWINDVSGNLTPKLLDLLKLNPSINYVLTHSLSVPTNPNIILNSDSDPIETLKNWWFQKSEILDQHGINLNRIIFDPGLGFGKTSTQSLEIMDRAEELSTLPVRLLFGHSRKSFLHYWKNLHLDPLIKRFTIDEITHFWSEKLSKRGVDILRVHNFEKHLTKETQ